jgi:hypothetical protein
MTSSEDVLKIMEGIVLESLFSWRYIPCKVDLLEEGGRNGAHEFD